ncbi:MAG TPA: sulfotransferase [Flavobacteriales bacterium]|nr:sulfotransferase [Flavobacteriales bacterium]
MIFKTVDKAKIFCISTQRTGTTSVGDFFRQLGFKVAGWSVVERNNWSKLHFDGNYDAIFDSNDFKKSKVFEDGPWSVGHFYKYLFYHFPDSKFILFERDANDWFNSMISHSKGMTIGNTFRHCTIYNRETEYYAFMGEKHSYENGAMDNLLPIPETMRQHYVDIYLNRNRQAVDFFAAKDPGSNRFIRLDLEDKNKWSKLGKYFGLRVPEGMEVHSNKTLKQ